MELVSSPILDKILISFGNHNRHSLTFFLMHAFNLNLALILYLLFSQFMQSQCAVHVQLAGNAVLGCGANVSALIQPLEPVASTLLISCVKQRTQPAALPSIRSRNC